MENHELMEWLERHDDWLEREFHSLHQHIDRSERKIMGADEDLQAAVAALVAEDGIVLAVVTDLANKAATSSSGTVPASDVTSAVSQINAEIGRAQGALAAADASVATPTPTDSGSTGAPSTEPTPAPDASSGSAPTDTGGDVTASPGSGSADAGTSTDTGSVDTGSTDASQAAPDAGSTPTS